MDNKLFLMDGDRAAEMQVQVKGYENEAYLQKIIRDNPNLLARSIENGIFKKLYLIEQEYAIRELEDGGNMYSLDHLLVDEDGIPVLVEVKRSTDTRIKREVVAQMLDYASRASKWNIREIRDSFERNNPEADPEFFDDGFWEKVATNLSAEHFRLIFAADEIPDTLRVLIEFMDRSMKDIEVYGVELKPYRTDTALLLASNVVGNSLLGSTKASSSGKREIYTRTVDEFKDDFRKRGFNKLVPVFEQIYSFAESIGLSWESGTGAKHPAYKAKLNNRTLFRIVLWNLYSSEYRALAEFDIVNISSKFLHEKEDKESVRTRLTGIFKEPESPDESLLSSPETAQYIDLYLLTDPHNMARFQEAIKLLVDDIRRESASS